MQQIRVYLFIFLQKHIDTYMQTMMPVFRGVAPWHCAKGPAPQRGPALWQWSPQRWSV